MSDYPLVVDCPTWTFHLKVSEAAERQPCCTIRQWEPGPVRGCLNSVRPGEVAYWADTARLEGRWRCLDCMEVMMSRGIAHESRLAQDPVYPG